MAKKFILSFSLIVSIALSGFVSGCATTGGSTPSEAEINAEAAKAYQEFKNKSKISTNKQWNDMVQRVTQRIAAASGENFQWEAVLVENNEPNAWCMPGGKIAVYTGIMPIVKTEAALAAVLGHEVAHATRRHGLKNYARAIQESQTGMVIGLATIVGGQLLCKSEECQKWTALGGAAAGIALTFFNRKFSRADEGEADSYGLEYMSKAGYQPTESVELWKRMNAAGGGQIPEWMSTHPSGDNRIKALNNEMPKAQQIYQQAPNKYGLGQST